MKSLPHDSAHLHVQGMSEYIDDRPTLPGELFVEPILSTESHAKVLSIEWSLAEKDPEFVGVLTGRDFVGNIWGTIFKDQPILASELVSYCGEPVALMVTRSRWSARRLRSLVKVKYQKLPAIFSIDDAIKVQSFIGPERFIKRGDVDLALKKSEHRISGTLKIAGADHFYLESQAAVAYPQEDGQIEIHSSSQHPTETQHVVAHALGLPDKDVVCIVKRMGGAFGGKESQAAPFAAYAALAAQRFNAPARIAISKDDDMIITGKRNPFQNHYEVGFDSNGKILALKVRLFSDGGAYADLSTSIMERAMLHCDNAYYIPDVHITGQVCKTNFHPHTAFRGFGGPKGVATIERIIEEIAFVLNKDPLEIRKANCYGIAGSITPYGQEVKNNCLPTLFEKIETSSNYKKRRIEIQKHNEQVLSGRSTNRQIRGLSTTAVKFGISFTTKFLNQANALVIVHLDGSVQVTTGATEMGQGVYARIADLVASELGIQRKDIRVLPTRTDKNANTAPTAASSGTDLNGAAALLATRKIKARLSHLFLEIRDLPREKWACKTAGLGTHSEVQVRDTTLPGDDPNYGTEWESGSAAFEGVVFENGEVYHRNEPNKRLKYSDLVFEAYYHRISLSDYAHYKFPGLSFDKLTGQGEAFLYFTQGVATSEVSVDLETGDVKVLRTDLLMDLGRPVNEALDIGQVTGGFVQGMGWVTTEKLFYSQNGLLLSHAPSTYKIPNIQDTPRVFNVKLLENKQNKVNVRGTKAVGEPPLLLALSVWTAVQNALTYTRRDSYPRLSLPATQEEVLRGLYPEEFSKWESN